MRDIYSKKGKEKDIYTQRLGVGMTGKIINMSNKELTPGLPSIDWGQIAHLCRLKENQFVRFGERINTPDGPLFFKDNGQNVLAVFHADVYMGAIHTKPLHLADDTLFYCPALDDRLGGYAILEYLPKLGVQYDILITTGEETFQSTARYFNPPRQYHWMFSFDRRGKEVVLYDYADVDTIMALREQGFVVGKGTFSDICFLEHLGCKGFNFGAGYYLEHTSRCYFSKREFQENIIKFRRFYNKWKHTPFPHVPAVNFYSAKDGFGYLRKPFNMGTPALFQDEDIENISKLDKAGYQFEQPITLDDIKEAVDTFVSEEKKKEMIDPNQLDIFAAESKEKVKDRKIKMVVKLPIFPSEAEKLVNEQQRYINRGSEDRLGISCKAEVNKDVPWYDEPRKASETILDNRTLQIVKITHIDKKEEIPADNGNEITMLDVCTECHRGYQTLSSIKTTVCPDCLRETFPKERTKHKFEIIGTLTIDRGKEKHGTQIYQDKGEGLKWYGIAEYEEIASAA